VAVAGYAILAAFCVCYLTTLHVGWVPGQRRYWVGFGLATAMFLVEIPIARADAFAMCVFLTALVVTRRGAGAVPAVAAMTLASVLVPAAIPGWHDGLGTSVTNGTAIAIPMVGLAMFGFFNVMKGSYALAQARAELARLAAENERVRIARDLHDLLGHSLTTITVKAALARRLAATDMPGAVSEIADVETLTRQALTDVRSAVASYRDVTLTGELATGRELLRAAGIVADLPRATDIADPGTAELFGWVLREGLTNVVRHSHADTCVVRVSATTVEITDDGVGGGAVYGNGLSGLRERVEAAGGTLAAGPVSPRGWTTRVSLTPAGAL